MLLSKTTGYIYGRNKVANINKNGRVSYQVCLRSSINTKNGHAETAWHDGSLVLDLRAVAGQSVVAEETPEEHDSASRFKIVRTNTSRLTYQAYLCIVVRNKRTSLN